ncbi:MAG: NUDIX hydrolase [Egibacteraceae bacterium]
MTPQLPADLPVVERDVVRLVVLDTADRLLLFATRDPTLPELGEWWELPGGGLEDGETYADAAVWELHEETGIVIGPGHVGPATWRRSASFRHRGARRLQHEVVAAVRLDAPGPAIDGAGRCEVEREDYFDHRWWPLPEVVASRSRFYPGRLPALLRRFLAGEPIDEPFELWS